jgi:hypothetical protein
MHEYGHVILSINCWEQGLALIENNLWAERPISTEKRPSLLRYAHFRITGSLADISLLIGV